MLSCCVCTGIGCYKFCTALVKERYELECISVLFPNFYYSLQFLKQRIWITCSAKVLSYTETEEAEMFSNPFTISRELCPDTEELNWLEHRQLFSLLPQRIRNFNVVTSVATARECGIVVTLVFSLLGRNKEEVLERSAAAPTAQIRRDHLM